MVERSSAMAEVRETFEALEFKEKGYAVFENVLDPELLNVLRKRTHDLLFEEYRKNTQQAFPYQGSMIPVDYKQEEFAQLISNDKSLKSLQRLGFDHPKWMSGYIINKPPDAPPLWWHQDWWAWDEDCSHDEIPPQAFLMYYLQETTPVNGCLRVLPRSHRMHTELHDQLPPPHSKEINSMSAESPAFQIQKNEVDVLVRAGDVVVGDARLLHATHANTSDENRTCITLWYLPDFEHLPPNIQSYVVGHHCLPPQGWWRKEHPDVPSNLRSLLPVYEGETRPVAFNRDPRRTLRNLSLQQFGKKESVLQLTP